MSDSDVCTDDIERSCEDGEIVYLPAQGNGNGSPVVHTDSDCSRLQAARKVHKYPRGSLSDKRICKYCSDEITSAGGNNSGPWQDLQEADPNDLITDGGVDVDDTEQTSGSWIGTVRGVRVRGPGPDADGAILEIVGERGLAAMEFDNEAFVDALSHTAAEIQMVLDDRSQDPEPDQNRRTEQ